MQSSLVSSKLKSVGHITRFSIAVVAAPTKTRHNVDHSVFDQLPDSAYLREAQLVRSPKHPDSLTAPLPLSAPTLWRMVKEGRFPKPHKLSSRVTAWQVQQVRAWLQAQANA